MKQMLQVSVMLSLAPIAHAQHLGACQSFYPANYTLPQGQLNPAMVSTVKPLKGQVRSEPNFGTCQVRATDHAAEAPSTFARNDYSRRQAFNANESLMLVYANDGFWHVYDANTLAYVKRLNGLAADAEPHWHPTNPSLLYYVPTNGGTQLLLLNVDSNTTTVAADFAGRLPSWAQNARHIWTKSEGSPSADARYWGFQVEDANFNLLGYITWDLSTNSLVGAMQSSARPDHTSMSASGRWFTISSGNGTWAWSLDFSQKKKLHNTTEHSDLALMKNGNDAYVAVDYQSNAGDVFYTDIDSCPSVAASVTTATVCPRVVLFPNYINGAATAIHFSGKGYGKPGWVVVSTYAGSLTRDGQRPWYSDKVFIAELAPNPRFYPLAYTHRKNPSSGSAYWTEPHASVSRSFTRAVYNSNWEVDSATDIDAYVVHIPPSSFGDAQPPVEPTCTRAAPVATISGPSAALAAGSVAQYSITLSNRDSAACESTTFSLRGTVPASWSSSLPATASISPQGQQTLMWSVTSPSGASAGSYPVNLAVSSSQSVHSVAAASSYQVSAPAPSCTRAAPTLTFTGSTSPVAAGTAVTYQVQVKNNDSSSCPSSVFAVAGTVPSNWGKSINPATLTLAPGQSGQAALAVASLSTTTAGSYNVAAGISSAAGSVHTASRTIAYTVSAPPAAQCTRAKPTITIGQPAISGNTRQYPVTVRNNDSASCASALFGLDGKVPVGSSGWLAYLSQATSTLAPQKTWNTTLLVSVPASTSGGNYNVELRHSSALSIHTGAVQVPISVKVTGGSSQPRVSAAPTPSGTTKASPATLSSPTSVKSPPPTLSSKRVIVVPSAPVTQWDLNDEDDRDLW